MREVRRLERGAAAALPSPSIWTKRRLDLAWSDLLSGWLAVLGAHERTRRRARVEARCDRAGRAFACLSVRSGLDRLLQALAFPEGSEVLVSALTIPNMLRVLEAHALVPAPVDLDLDTMAPTPAALRAAVGPRPRAIDDYWTNQPVLGTTDANGSVSFPYTGLCGVGALAFLVDSATSGTLSLNKNAGLLSVWAIPE